MTGTHQRHLTRKNQTIKSCWELYRLFVCFFLVSFILGNLCPVAAERTETIIQKRQKEGRGGGGRVDSSPLKHLKSERVEIWMRTPSSNATTTVI